MVKWQGFYSASQVSRLAGIPKRTLNAWKQQGIISPSVKIINADGNTEEGYSFSDLAIVKLLYALRIRKINLISAANALRHLYERFGAPNSEGWSNAHVYVINKEVFAQKPDDWDTTEATRKGQKAEMKVLGVLFEEEGGLLVPKSFSEYIEINPNVMDGEPVIKNTRVPTFILAQMFEEGASAIELARLYSPISVMAIKKAVDFEKSLNKTAKASAQIRASIN